VVAPVVDRPLDEAELVERARRGDLRAWETIVRTHQGIAFRTAYLLAGSAADAEEAAQDAFVKAYRALGRFRRGAPLRPWLLRIVANEAHNRRRSAARRDALALRAAAEHRPGDAVPSPEAALAAGVLGRLSPSGTRPFQWRRAVVLALALVAIAVATAFAVPQARTAILRFFHLGGATVIRVETLPPAVERKHAGGLGRP